MADNSSNKIKGRMKRKTGLIFGLFCLIFVLLFIRVFYISYTSGSRYEKIVLAQLNYNSELLPYKRGDIYDTKGTVLATSVDVYNLILDCKVLNASTNDKRRQSTIDKIYASFPEVKKNHNIEQILRDYPDSSYKILAKRMPYEEISDFVEYMDNPDTSGEIAGVWFEKEYKRNYPYGTMAADVIGFSTTGNLGVVGLENQYNSTLNGVNGRMYGYLNSDSNLEKTVISPTDGNNIYTTIDANVQSIVEKAIVDWNDQHIDEAREIGFGSTDTAVLVMNPQNGEVLAMASYPFFDLSNPRNLDSFSKQIDIQHMTDEEELDFLNKVWQNYVTTFTFEPGSVMKPLTVACGLDTGTLKGDEKYICDGHEFISDFEIHCVKRFGHGEEDIAGALSDSCNDALMQMSYAIGSENFSKYEELFGIGLKTNVDLPGEARTDTLIYHLDDLSRLNLAVNSFGQSFNVTMIQMGAAYCSLVNGGTFYQPHIVKKITDSNGAIVREINPTVIKKTISKETSDKVKEYLLSVVATGTAQAAGVEGYDIGGKTGTAEKLPRKNGNYVVSFIGYAPQENPEVVVYVCINEPNVADQPHSTYAQEIAHQIFAELLPYMNVEKNEEGKAKDAEAEAIRALEEEVIDVTWPESYNKESETEPEESAIPKINLEDITPQE